MVHLILEFFNSPHHKNWHTRLWCGSSRHKALAHLLTSHSLILRNLVHKTTMTLLVSLASYMTSVLTFTHFSNFTHIYNNYMFSLYHLTWESKKPCIISSIMLCLFIRRYTVNELLSFYAGWRQWQICDQVIWLFCTLELINHCNPFPCIHCTCTCMFQSSEAFLRFPILQVSLTGMFLLFCICMGPTLECYGISGREGQGYILWNGPLPG